MRPTSYVLPWKEGAQYSFVPLCCPHFPIGDRDMLKEWIAQVNDDPLAFTILLGDNFDFARTHFRKHAKKHQEEGNSQIAIDNMHRKEVEELAQLLKPIRSKIIGCIKGNHQW